MQASAFSTLYHLVEILNNDKTKFKAAFRKYLNTHSFYSADGYVMYKDDF
jgi:hypothetical protein